MSDTPEDIMQAAREALYDYPPIVRQCLTDVARAIENERERCAKIAEGFNCPNGEEWEIAAAIRSQAQ